MGYMEEKNMEIWRWIVGAVWKAVRKIKLMGLIRIH